LFEELAPGATAWTVDWSVMGSGAGGGIGAAGSDLAVGAAGAGLDGSSS